LAGKSGSGREEWKHFFRSLKRRKALEGEAQECGRLKEASKGEESFNAIERVAKP
jgi:hypothetical protein